MFLGRLSVVLRSAAASRQDGFSLSHRHLATTIPIEPQERASQELRYNEKGERVFTREEVARHKSVGDCWLILEGKVYNVTSWIDLHPGGDSIRKGAGIEATDHFNYIGHSDHARSLLDQYFIGVVDTEPRYTLSNPTPGTKPTERQRF